MRVGFIRVLLRMLIDLLSLVEATAGETFGLVPLIDVAMVVVVTPVDVCSFDAPSSIVSCDLAKCWAIITEETGVLIADLTTTGGDVLALVFNCFTTKILPADVVTIAPPLKLFCIGNFCVDPLCSSLVAGDKI